MNKRPGRRISVRLSRVDRERLEKSQREARDTYGDCGTKGVNAKPDNLDDHSATKSDQVDPQSKNTLKEQHTQRLRSRGKQPPLSAEDRRLLEELPPHWTGGNQ